MHCLFLLYQFSEGINLASSQTPMTDPTMSVYQLATQHATSTTIAGAMLGFSSRPFSTASAAMPVLDTLN
jgi:hypothetical protein